MTSLFMTAIIAPFALQAAPATNPQSSAPVAFASLDELPIQESTAPRCGVAFALVSQWQKDGDPRGTEYPNMETEGGREFFVRSVANLMEGRELSRKAVSDLLAREFAILDSNDGAERVEAMMPACLLMKQSAGL